MTRQPVFLYLFVQTIFPRPNTNNRLSIRCRDIFGEALVGDRNPDDRLFLDLVQLRTYATKALGKMNLVPA